MRNPAPQFVKIWLSGPNHAPALRKTANITGDSADQSMAEAATASGNLPRAKM
jgi:hypothetical protein